MRPILMVTGVLMAGIAFLVGPRAMADSASDDALLKALPGAKLSLSQGIAQAAAKVPEVAISAKFEMDHDGKLSLSVYTAEKGLETDAEHNVLKELSGSPTGDAWVPEVEVFKDAEHLKRSSAQLTLMSVSPSALADVVKKAEKDRPGTVYSIAPAVQNRKAVFAVLVAVDGKSVALTYDLVTGAAVKQ